MNKEEVNIALYKKLQPVGGISFKDESLIKTGDGYETCLHVMDYPPDADDFWLANITNIDNTVATIDISNLDKNEVKKNLNRSMKEQNTRYKNATNYTDESEASDKFLDMKTIIDDIQQMSEVMKCVDARIFVADRSWLELDERTKKIKEKLDNDGYRNFTNLNETKSDWMSMYQPYLKQQENPFAVPGQPLTAEALSGGNPFHFSSLDDPNGRFYGVTPTLGNVFWDMFIKTRTRKFYNCVTVGTMGSGKSTLLKKQFEDRAIRGDFVRTFDVSGEFTLLTDTYGGKVLKLDGSDDNALNPLEILKSGDNEGINYARHIAKLNTMYRFLVPDCSNEVVTEFSNTLTEMYQEWSLNPETNNKITGLPSLSYPIFSDLKVFVENKMNFISNQEYNEVELVVAQNEILMLDGIKKVIINLIQTYGKLFNQHTSMNNIDDEQIVTFDISKLKDMDATVFDAQIFNLVSLCWDNCVTNGTLMNDLYHNKKEIAFEDIIHTLIIIDESHRWINAQKLQALDLITVYMREARKYFGGISLASQSIRDYVPEGANDISINKLKTLFELTQYKFIFHQDTNALPIFDQIFENVLTSSQRNRIPKLETGDCILCIASDQNLEFSVYITEEEEYIFNGGV